MKRIYDDHLHMMEAMGGSFVRSLAACYYCADGSNKARLEAAFPEYFNKYREMWKEQKAKLNEQEAA